MVLLWAFPEDMHRDKKRLQRLQTIARFFLWGRLVGLRGLTYGGTDVCSHLAVMGSHCVGSCTYNVDRYIDLLCVILNKFTGSKTKKL